MYQQLRVWVIFRHAHVNKPGKLGVVVVDLELRVRVGDEILRFGIPHHHSHHYRDVRGVRVYACAYGDLVDGGKKMMRLLLLRSELILYRDQFETGHPCESAVARRIATRVTAAVPLNH